MTPPSGSPIPRGGHPGRSAMVAGIQPFGGEVVVDRLLCGGDSLFTEPQRLPNPERLSALAFGIVGTSYRSRSGLSAVMNR